MGEFVFKLPDVGEGLAEAELVHWQVAIGDEVHEDSIIAAVMTDKATVDIPSPVSGKVLWLGGEVGDVMAIGADLIRFEIAGPDNHDSGGNHIVDASNPADKSLDDPERLPRAQRPETPLRAASITKESMANGVGRSNGDEPPAIAPSVPHRRPGEKPLAAPSVRKRALDSGVDLRQVAGTGPAGRITHDDLDGHLQAGQSATATSAKALVNTTITDVKVVGLRRKIAEKMVISMSRIPHITYVEEVDMTKLEELRDALNESRSDEQTRLTVLPFLMRAMVRAIADQPQINALFDDDNGIIHQHGGVHIGTATQTDAGLVVPVLRHVEAMEVWDCAAELTRLAQGARDNSLTREELTGSTITITSLGPMGGIATTPVINYPEVAIVGVNKMSMRPMWDGSQFVPRKMMNLSASFDHRVIDGWDAATFVQKVKSLLETPAMIFMSS